ncbi:MAG: 30S ribosomal protein S16 [Candidatus Poribacteria bacterium]|nr:30S ribosomal protein S16 [Candidatus Poribacteria bacterium]
MSARIRLQRAGRKKRPFFRVVVADQKANRDGKFVEQLGYWDPVPEEQKLELNEERSLYWLQQGAQPSDTAKALLRRIGVWQKFKAPGQVEAAAAASDEATTASE